MQNHREINKPLDMNKWREIIDAWDKSGENQKSYCARLGVNLNTFSYARSKLQSKPKTQFIPLTIKSRSDETALLPSVIVLENSQGYKLHIPASLSLEQLTKLFKVSGWNNA